MLKLLAGLISSFALLWIGIGGAEWWERRPTHTPAIHVLFLNWSPADGLAAQRDADKARLAQAEANVVTLQAGIGRQNAAVDEAEARTKATLLALDQASIQSRNGRAVAESRAQAILARKPEGDACKAAEAVLRGK